MCCRLLRAGVDGFVVRDEVPIGITDAVSALLRDAHYFSKCIVTKLVRTPALTQLVDELQTSFRLTSQRARGFPAHGFGSLEYRHSQIAGYQ